MSSGSRARIGSCWRCGRRPRRPAARGQRCADTQPHAHAPGAEQRARPRRACAPSACRRSAGARGRRRCLQRGVSVSSACKLGAKRRAGRASSGASSACRWEAHTAAEKQRSRGAPFICSARSSSALSDRSAASLCGSVAATASFRSTLRAQRPPSVRSRAAKQHNRAQVRKSAATDRACVVELQAQLANELVGEGRALRCIGAVEPLGPGRNPVSRDTHTRAGSETAGEPHQQLLAQLEVAAAGSAAGAWAVCACGVKRGVLRGGKGPVGGEFLQQRVCRNHEIRHAHAHSGHLRRRYRRPFVAPVRRSSTTRATAHGRRGVSTMTPTLTPAPVG
jgi:hypothetical protein